MITTKTKDYILTYLQIVCLSIAIACSFWCTIEDYLWKLHIYNVLDAPEGEEYITAVRIVFAIILMTGMGISVYKSKIKTDAFTLSYMADMVLLIFIYAIYFLDFIDNMYSRWFFLGFVLLDIFKSKNSDAKLGGDPNVIVTLSLLSQILLVFLLLISWWFIPNVCPDGQEEFMCKYFIPFLTAATLLSYIWKNRRNFFQEKILCSKMDCVLFIYMALRGYTLSYVENGPYGPRIPAFILVCSPVLHDSLLLIFHKILTIILLLSIVNFIAILLSKK